MLLSACGTALLSSKLRVNRSHMMGSTQRTSGDATVRMMKDRRVDLRRKTRLATWNAFTLSGSSYVTSLVCELEKYKVHINR